MENNTSDNFNSQTISPNQEVANQLSQINQKIESLQTKIDTSSFNSQSNSQSSSQSIQLKGLNGFLWTYFFFGLPGFLINSLIILILLISLVGLVSLSSKIEKSLESPSQTAKSENLKIAKKVGKPSGDDGILVYNLTGAISTGGKGHTGKDGIWTDLVSRDFDLIKQNNQIKNVVFRLNTPGGEVFASEIIGDLIGDLVRAKGQQQTIFYFDQTVASGGLLAAYKNPNYVVASQYGETGSIGVRTSIPNFEKLASNIGYKELIIKSGANKDYGNPLREPLPEEVNFIQKQVDEKYESFVEIVAKGRNLQTGKVKEFANGFVYDNSVAKSFGLIDELGGVEIAYNKAAGNSQLGQNYNIWEMENLPNPLQEIFGGLGANAELGVLKKIESKISLKNGTIYAIEETRLD